MAKTCRTSRAARSINSVFRALTRLGLGAPYRDILTVPGRKTGRLYSMPVDLLELDDERCLSPTRGSRGDSTGHVAVCAGGGG
jgi:hypothetical protein